MNIFISKFKESLFSVLPVVGIVYILLFTPLFDLPMMEKIVFSISSVVLIIGMTLFNIGADISMTIMGDLVGAGLVRTKKVFLIVVVGLIMGVFVTIAEPDLMVLAGQVKDAIDEKSLIISVGFGVGVFLAIALLRTIYNRRLAMLILLFYMLLFALNALLVELGKDNFVPLAFDSGGVTTGPITVPFIMAFGVGIATTLGGKRINENSFGYVALCSVGPILVVMIFMLLSKGNLTYKLGDYSIESILNRVILNITLEELSSVGEALILIFMFFMAINYLFIKLPFNKIMQIVVGLLITCIGLVLFLTSASIGFLPVGFSLGSQLIKANKTVAILLCFIIGMTVVLAEPAVQVLNRQVEEITGGTVTKRQMMIALSIGVGIAISLSCIRIIYGFSLLYYLIPGYFISLALSLFVPPIYTSIAFDSGGVASGPLTSTFILPFMIGACATIAGENEILRRAFGVVAMVAMTPLISIQLLGFKAIATKVVKDKISMGRILKADDDQIVYIEY